MLAISPFPSFFGPLNRPGSITATQGRCGNPNCHCHRPGESSHGPNLRLTYKARARPLPRASPRRPCNARPSANWPSFAGFRS
ncbi:MAG: DUF6788 family protein [Bryobacteraceae bacterium]